MGPAVHSSTTSTWGQPVTVRSVLTNRWDPDVSTRDTIRVLCQLAHRFAADPIVRQATMQAFWPLGSGSDQRERASAIFYWVRDNVQFVQDEELLYHELGVPLPDLDKELLIVPPLLLRMPVPMGDCDDYSLLIASMLLAAGMRPYWVTVAADQTDPHRFSHIYLTVHLADEGKTHLSLDAGNKLQGIPPGWEPKGISRKAIWRV